METLYKLHVVSRKDIDLESFFYVTKTLPKEGYTSLLIDSGNHVVAKNLYDREYTKEEIIFFKKVLSNVQHYCEANSFWDACSPNNDFRQYWDLRVNLKQYLNSGGDLDKVEAIKEGSYHPTIFQEGDYGEYVKKIREALLEKE